MLLGLKGDGLEIYNIKIYLRLQPFFRHFSLYGSYGKKCFLNHFFLQYLKWPLKNRPVWHLVLIIQVDPVGHHCAVGVDANYRCNIKKMRLQLLFCFSLLLQTSDSCGSSAIGESRIPRPFGRFDRLTLARRFRSSSLGPGPVLMGRGQWLSRR